MIYITSDFHFNHQKEFIYEPRGFSSPIEMNEVLLENFNSIVKPEDEVYILGDLMLGGSVFHRQGLELIRALNGKLHIIRGNHDTDLRWSAYSKLENVVECENSIYLHYKKYHFYLSHYPSMTSNYTDEKSLKSRTLNLCGHTHTKDIWQHWMTGSYHCEVDAHDNKPVSIDEIIEDMKSYETEQKDYDTLMTEVLNLAANTIYPRCDKCVYDFISCHDNDKDGKCKTYKRDPPDGGYYG